MKKLRLLIIIGVVLIAFALPTQATALTFELDFEFSGAQSPVGTPPWLTATFDDYSSGLVRLTLDASGLTANEFVAGSLEASKGWYFNFHPEKDVNSLTFTFIPGGNSADAIGTGENLYKAGGDGNYDILFTWDKQAGALTAGQTAVYDITSSTYSDLSASWFEFLSAPAGGHGPFLSAAHVQGIGYNNEGSGWIAPNPIPEPATMLLFGSGLIGLAGLGRKKFFKKS